MRTHTFILAGIAVVALSPEAFGQTPSFSRMGVLPGSTFSEAYDVNGVTVVGASRVGIEVHAVRWRPGAGLVDLGRLPDMPSSAAYAASTTGNIIVGNSGRTLESRAFRWTSTGGMTELPSLPGASYSVAWGMTDNGSAAVGYSGSFGSFKAVKWSGSNVQSLGELPGAPGRQSFAVDISDNGLIVGYGQTPQGSRAFRWTVAAGMQSLGTLAGGEFSAARAISDDGSVIVGTSGGPWPQHAFRWTASGGMQDLGVLAGGISTYALGVSANGSVVVGYEPSLGGAAESRAWMWTEHSGLVDFKRYLIELGLDVHAWQLVSARSVSDDGLTIVGRGIYNGVEEGWIATVPAPGVGVVFAFGAVICTRRKRASPRAVFTR